MITPLIATEESFNIDELRRQSTSNDPKVLNQVAKQLESFFFKMMMKSLQKANEAIKSDFFDNKQTEFYEQMYYQEIALNKMTQGLGLKELIVKQLQEDKPADKSINRDNVFHYARNDGQIVSHQQGKEIKFDTPNDFINYLLPYAAKALDRLNMKPDLFKKVLVAQAALETNFGQSMIRDQAGKNSFNLFGIKANKNANLNDSTQTSVLARTHEFKLGKLQAQTEQFRSYASYEASFDDFVAFIQENPRYKKLMKSQTPHEFAQRLQEAGFATDPHYAKKIMTIYKQML